jgi:HK97 family phage portal protein
MKLIELGLNQPEKRDNGDQLTPALPIAQIARWGDLFGGAGSDSGETVTPLTSMQSSAVNASVRLISKSVAATDLILYEQSGTGKQAANSNLINYLLQVEPNSDCVADTLWESFTASILLHGNGYIEIETNKQNNVVGLWYLTPERVQPYRQPDGSIIYKCFEGMATGEFRTLKSTQIIHVPGLSFNGVTGVSVIEQARNIIGSNLAMDRFNARFYANNSTPSGVITLPAPMKAKPEDRTKMRQDWDEMQGGRNQRRVAVLDQGMTFSPLSISQADSEYISSKNMSRQEIAGLFNLHPAQIGDTSRVAGETYASQQQAYLTDCLHPLLKKIRNEVSRKLLPRSQNPDGKYSLEHDSSYRLKLDAKSQMEAYAIGRQWGFYTANQVRKELGENPGGPECEVYLSPLNMVDAKTLLLPPATPTAVVQNE